jgi:predicted GNAT family acetyltransferase
VQVQQVWVDPEVRGHGYGQRGMRDLCRLLLETTPAVTLFVRTENAVAIHVYEAIGMRRALTYRSILFP